MFGNKQPNPQAAPNSFISNRINHGTTFEGSITSDGDVRIEGLIRGTLHTKAKVAVGPTGVIEGDVYCKSADIGRRITGDLEVSEVLTLKSTAVVEGNIYTAKIVIENGAHFDGVCNMGTKERKLTNVSAQYEEATV
ncbi:MAG: polymer-forming cytoskeletal protein [Bacteroidetes bacterium]|nr:polymer-forming cytoskeletal protein [Bacteroidota bacterium]